MRLSEATPEVLEQMKRRRFIAYAAAGTTLAVLGGLYVLPDSQATRDARRETRADGRPRLPPGQRVLSKLKDMGGRRGDPEKSTWTIRIHGDVEQPVTLDFRQLLDLEQVEGERDVHCVTGWSRLGATWGGVKMSTLADLVGLKSNVSHVVFEAARGYTTNVPVQEALAEENMLAHRLDGAPLDHRYGGPVRGLVPELYFWKSAKWITGIKFQGYDSPGYWEVRGYHNHADPWKEERHG